MAFNPTELRRLTPKLLVAALVGLVPLACNDEAPDDAPDVPEMDPGAEMDPQEGMEEFEPPESPDADELAGHELTLDEVEQWVRVQERVADAAEDDPELPARIRQEVEGMSPGAGGILSLDEQAQVVETEQAYVDAVEAEGMTAREFARTAMVISGAYTLYEVEEAGEPVEMYEQEFPWVTEGHVAFVRDNQADLEPLLDRYMEATQRLEGADPEAMPPPDAEPQPPEED